MANGTNDPRYVELRLTVAEAMNLCHAAGNSLDSEDDADGIFTDKKDKAAAYRGFEKLTHAAHNPIDPRSAEQKAADKGLKLFHGRHYGTINGKEIDQLYVCAKSKAHVQRLCKAHDIWISSGELAVYWSEVWGTEISKEVPDPDVGIWGAVKNSNKFIKIAGPDGAKAKG